MVLLALLLLACSAAPDPAGIAAGAAKHDLLRSFGEPSSRQTMIKLNEAVFGPIETFWSGVPMNASVEIWSYPAKGGSVELYFLGGSDTVNATAFAPYGVVYEASPPTESRP